MAGQVVNQPQLPRLAEARGAANPENPTQDPWGVQFAIRCHAPTGKQSYLDLRGDGVDWGRPAYSPRRRMAADTCRLLSLCMQRKIQMFGVLDRYAAGFEPVDGRDARFNQPTAQSPWPQNPDQNQKEGPVACTKFFSEGRGPGESATSRVMSSTLSARDLKMAARMYRVIGHLGCNFEIGGHIRDGTSWLPKILPKICRSGKTLW